MTIARPGATGAAARAIDAARVARALRPPVRMCNEMIAWLVAAMSAWAPPKPADLPRYDAIARDVLSVAFDDAEPPLVDGPDGRARTALLLASFAEAESGGFRADIVDGRKRGRQGAVCMLQVKVPPEGTDEGWTKRDLVDDRTICVRAALHRLRDSAETCHALHGADRFGMYTHGRCVSPNGIARFRVGRARAWASKHAAPTDDGRVCVASSGDASTRGTRDAP